MERVEGDILTVNAIRKKLEKTGERINDRTIAEYLKRYGITKEYIEKKEFKISLKKVVRMGCIRIMKGGFSYIIRNGVITTVQKDIKNAKKR